jgi:hypothetical protein
MKDQRFSDDEIWAKKIKVCRKEIEYHGDFTCETIRMLIDRNMRAEENIENYMNGNPQRREIDLLKGRLMLLDDLLMKVLESWENDNSGTDSKEKTA